MHVPKGYIYFAMAFSLFVEMINLRVRRSKQPPVHLHAAYRTDDVVAPGSASTSPPAPAGDAGTRVR